ncbi:MAG TPA: efflux RND transporter periplasmic adaptor subunit [Cyclobacteriaceae bacterium]|nr:efflux RND transporter periplasmic adaptor subunit [Cyclobacteriaceae bacterium]
MKRNWRNKAHYLLFVVAVLLAGCNSGEHSAHDDEQYSCSMHPQVIQDKPGRCPICGMDLVRTARSGEEVKITKKLGYLLKPVNSVVTASIKTVFPVRKASEIVIEAKGTITHDTRKIATISTRFGGRIEKQYIKYRFQPIHKGQKILEIYSPELVTAQRELLYLLDKDAGNIEMIRSSRVKLHLLGLTESQVGQIVSSGKESYSFPVYSPVEGYIMEHSESGPAAFPTPAEADQPMDESSGLKIREGMYVKTGESIFTVVSHSAVWAEFDLYPKEAPYVKLNDPVTITLDDSPEEHMESKVSFIQPFIKDGENRTKVRMYLSNPHSHYHAGQLVSAALTTSSGNSIWIPANARLDLGTRDIVFIKRYGVFRPMVISIGRRSTDWIEVLAGLDPRDSVAYNAQFMVDSEGFIKVNQKD